jgi:CheY-like chemotaxis protein
METDCPRSPTRDSGRRARDAGVSRVRRRALIIEDDSRVRLLLGELLDGLGYEVRATSDGAEGLRLFEPGRDELVVTDLMLPGVTGWEVAEGLRRDNSGLSLVIATGSVNNLDTNRLRDLRVVALGKPFTLPELRTAIDEARTLATISPAESQPTGGGAVRLSEKPEVEATLGRGSGWLSELRGAAEMARVFATKLPSWMAHVDAAVRERDDLQIRLTRLEHEHEKLQGAHETLVRAIDSRDAAYRQLQSECESLRDVFRQTNELYEARRRDIEGAVSALEGILARLQR